jgi:hypothetical protein
MRSPPDDVRRSRRRLAAFIAISAVAHVALLATVAALWTARAPIALALPETIEFGLVELDPGHQGAPAAVARRSAAAEPPPSKTPQARPKPAQASDALVVDAGVVAEASHAASPDAAVADSKPSLGPNLSADGAATAAMDGDGASPLAGGLGLGFGSGGFGNGTGGAQGAVIGLLANLDAIRENSLLLEVGAVLGLIPEWQRLLAGSGIDPLKSFSRIFVATPNLERASLVVSARFAGGEPFVEAAVQRLALARGATASFRTEQGMRIAPWMNQGPTERVVGLVAPDQLVIARASDVRRVVSVSESLARRHAKQPGMEKAEAPAALLSMYEGEDFALSVEGARGFVVGDSSFVPQALRISLRHLDEFHAELRVFGYYESAERARSAREGVDALRSALVNHPKVVFLGLQSALEGATLDQQDDTLTLHATLTLHQLRYLMAFTRRALEFRNPVRAAATGHHQ